MVALESPTVELSQRSRSLGQGVDLAPVVATEPNPAPPFRCRGAVLGCSMAENTAEFDLICGGWGGEDAVMTRGDDAASGTERLTSRREDQA